MLALRARRFRSEEASQAIAPGRIEKRIAGVDCGAAENRADEIGLARPRHALDDAPDHRVDLVTMLVQEAAHGGVPFRQGVFDGAISISAVQWLPICPGKENILKNLCYIKFNR